MLGYLGSWREAVAATRPVARATALAAAVGRPLDNPAIDTAEAFAALSVPAGDLVANGRVVKFLVDLRAPQAPIVHFVNGNAAGAGDAARYHYFFARTALGIPESLAEFNELTYFGTTKRYAAGVVHTYHLDGAVEPVYGLQFYPQDVVHEAGIVDVLRPVAAQVRIPGARLAFVQTGSQQTTASITADLAAAGLGFYSLDKVLGAIRYLPLNAGEAWGYLRIFPPPDRRLAPTDIPVFEELPLDLSVVAGVITKAVQDANSHVNLKSKERGTPNMVLRDAAPDDARLAPWRDQAVHFVVRADGFTLEATTDDEIARRLAARLDTPLRTLHTTAETTVRSFDELAVGTPASALAASRRYGTKAANLAFLAHRRVLGRVGQMGSASTTAGYDLVPRGVAVPLSFYGRLVAHPPNTKLRAALDALIRDQRAGTLAGDDLARRAAAVQQRFLDAVIPAADLAAIHDAVARVLPDAGKVKVRSSSNAEDIPNFDGAGLHDSFSAKVAKHSTKPRCMFDIGDADAGEAAVKRAVRPRTIGCAVKGVYASLWNRRAIEERAFARIDQATASMGLAIVPAYDEESAIAANAVVITRVLNTDDVFGYSISTQLGNNLVTNPDPATYSETIVAALGVDGEPTSLSVTRFAKPTADGPERTDTVLPSSATLAVVDLAARVEGAYCRAERAYYGADCSFVTVDPGKPKSLDLELKVLADGRLVCKQVREFGAH
jgi:Pyruvate phosphate dikinase, AMP/ATP-binding domain